MNDCRDAALTASTKYRYLDMEQETTSKKRNRDSREIQMARLQKRREITYFGKVGIAKFSRNNRLMNHVAKSKLSLSLLIRIIRTPETHMI